MANIEIPGFQGKTFMGGAQDKCTPEELLGEIMKYIPPGERVVLEIGTRDGVSIAWLASKCPWALFISVDPFVSQESRKWTGGESPTIWKRNRLGNWRANARPNQVLIMEPTPEVWDHLVLPQHGVDVVIVDGNHIYEWALWDLNEAFEHLAPGGSVFLHDESPRHPGVRKALAIFRKNGGDTIQVQRILKSSMVRLWRKEDQS